MWVALVIKKTSLKNGKTNVWVKLWRSQAHRILIGTLFLQSGYSLSDLSLIVADAADPSSFSSRENNSSGVETRLAPHTAPQHSVLNPKIIRYATYLMDKYDLNRDKVLQKYEWQAMHGQPESIDQNRDELISLDELTAWVADYAHRRDAGIPVRRETVSTNLQSGPTSPPSDAVPAERSETGETAVVTEGQKPATGERRRDQKFYVPPKRLPEGLPEWFHLKDKDGDGQLTASEFSETGVAAEMSEFSSYDANHDGVVTAKECVSKGSKKSSSTAQDGGSPSEKPTRSRRKPRANP